MFFQKKRAIQALFRLFYSILENARQKSVRLAPHLIEIDQWQISAKTML